MMKAFLLVLLCLGMPAWASLVGGHKAMTEEELRNKQYMVDKSVEHIRKDKVESNGAAGNCLHLSGTPISGTKQVVAGIVYRFNIEVSSSKVDSDECSAANVSPKKETCQMEVYVRPGSAQETTYTLKGCNESQ